MSKTEGMLLFDVTEINEFCQAAYFFGRCDQLPLSQKGFKCEVRLIVRFDERFMIPNYQDYGFDAARRCFFDGVLDQRLAGNRQHFLGKNLGRWKHPGAEARTGDYSCLDHWAVRHGRWLRELRGKSPAEGRKLHAHYLAWDWTDSHFISATFSFGCEIRRCQIS